MPKVFGSVSYQLHIEQEKNKILINKHHNLEAYNLQLKTLLAKHNIPLTKEHIHTKATTGSKGFVKETISSRNRKHKEPLPSSSRLKFTPINGRLYHWDAGYLIEAKATKKNGVIPDYQKPTVSSVEKRSTRAIDRETEQIRIAKENTWEDYEPTLLNEPQPSWTEEPKNEKFDETITEESLSVRSQLGRGIRHDLRYVPLPSEVIHDHCYEALKLGQRIFFHASKSSLSPVPQYESPHDISFGRTEFQDDVLYRVDNIEVNGHRKTTVDFKELFENIFLLRNMICHYSGKDAKYTLSVYDSYMGSVQKLAVFFEDEERAVEARRLRDSLETHAEQVARDAIVKWNFAALPMTEIPLCQDDQEKIPQSPMSVDADIAPTFLLHTVYNWDREDLQW
ncbi:hypothetical protein F4819DRAFT_504773 [Hypoxylon fuscum]|nr:hypothetical protein F4819DRAFT_504773 [Hypoxylon fuscum]